MFDGISPVCLGVRKRVDEFVCLYTFSGVLYKVGNVIRNGIFSGVVRLRCLHASDFQTWLSQTTFVEDVAIVLLPISNPVILFAISQRWTPCHVIMLLILFLVVSDVTATVHDCTRRTLTYVTTQVSPSKLWPTLDND